MSIRLNRVAVRGVLIVIGIGLGAAVNGQSPPGYYPPPAPPIAPVGPIAPVAPLPPVPPKAPPPIAPGGANPQPVVPVAQPLPGATSLPPVTPDIPLPSVVADPVPASAPAANKPNFDISWQNGLYFQTADENFSSHVGAAVQYDFAWYSATPILELDLLNGLGKFSDAANLRRARIFFEGTLYKAVDYKFEMEFMNGIGFSPAGTTNPTVAGSITNSPGPTDAWININDVPFFGNVRIGSQKEWFSLEHLNSFRYLEFMERSYLFDFSQMNRFNNGFSPGISVFRTWMNDRLFSGVGAYKNESDLLGFGIGDGQYAVTGRLAALPLWRPNDQVFWHVGGAMSHRDPVDGEVVVNVRDNIRNAPFPLLPLLIDTGRLGATSQDLFNFETAAVWGPLTFQAEYNANVINGAFVAATPTTPAGPPLGNLFFQGYYAEVMWLLTGESRTWNTKYFFFNRVVPKHPLKLKRGDSNCDGRGYGAWELGARITHLDVSNKAIRAGELDSVTIGLNWYLNANAKIQWNYDYTQRGNTDNPAQGHIHAFGMRTAFDF